MKGLSIKQLNTHGIGPVDLDIAPRECVCLSGPSGAGKTLVLRAIADLDLHEGEVSLNGENAMSHTGPEWRTRVGMLPAESQWWHETVGPHLPEDIDTQALEHFGFSREVLDWEINRLSTGERQRLAILRLLANRPLALLLDEPTASLDRENVDRVETLITDYRQQHDTPVLWVSHDPAQIERVSDRHIQIDQGRIEAA